MPVSSLPCFSQCLTEDVGQSVLLRCSLRTQRQCCCLLTTNFVVETGTKREGKRGRERVRLSVKPLQFTVACIFQSGQTRFVNFSTV